MFDEIPTKLANAHFLLSKRNSPARVELAEAAGSNGLAWVLRLSWL
jgi:hypothetical protein